MKAGASSAQQSLPPSKPSFTVPPAFAPAPPARDNPPANIQTAAKPPASAPASTVPAATSTQSQQQQPQMRASGAAAKAAARSPFDADNEDEDDEDLFSALRRVRSDNKPAVAQPSQATTSSSTLAFKPFANVRVHSITVQAYAITRTQVALGRRTVYAHRARVRPRAQQAAARVSSRCSMTRATRTISLQRVQALLLRRLVRVRVRVRQTRSGARATRSRACGPVRPPCRCPRRVGAAPRRPARPRSARPARASARPRRSRLPRPHSPLCQR